MINGVNNFVEGMLNLSLRLLGLVVFVLWYGFLFGLIVIMPIQLVEGIENDVVSVLVILLIWIVVPIAISYISSSISKTSTKENTISIYYKKIKYFLYEYEFKLEKNDKE